MTIAPAADRAAPPLAGYALAAAGAVLFSAKGIVIKLAYAEGIDAVTLLTLRMLLAVPFFVVVGLWTTRRHGRSGGAALSPGDLGKTVLVGMLGYWFSSWADFEGLTTLTPQFERLILFTYPLFVVLFGVLFFRQPFKPRALAAFGVSYAGLALVFAVDVRADGAGVAIGAAWVLAAAVAFALYQLIAKPLIARLGPSLFTSIAMTGASAAVVTQYLATRPLDALAVSDKGLALSVALAIGATVLPSYLMSAALQRISAQANATIGTLSPVVTLALAVLILGEEATLADLFGTVLVVGGIALFTLVERRDERAAAAAEG